jgi:hypothetical protein
LEKTAQRGVYRGDAVFVDDWLADEITEIQQRRESAD